MVRVFCVVVLTRGGIYRQMNVVAKRKMTLFEWKKLAHSAEHATPTLSDGVVDSTVRPAKRRKKSDDEGDGENVANGSKRRSADDSTEWQTRDELMPDSKFPSDIAYFKELERAYWKNLTFIAPLYGADVYAINGDGG
jgi:hypothetical protein